MTSVSSKATTDCPELYGCSEQGDCVELDAIIFSAIRHVNVELLVGFLCVQNVRGRLAAGSDIEVRIEVPFAK